MSISTKLQALVEPGWIAARIGDPSMRVVEVDVSPAAYDAGHIPGAVFWNAYGDLRPLEYQPLDHRDFASLLSRSAIEPDSTVVFYGYAAYLGYWLMRSYGHARVRLMDGPRERWLQAGQAWVAGTSDLVSETRYPARAACTDVVTREDMRGLIGDPDVVLLDVRSHEEFTGERFWPSGAPQEGGRAGHIPGAVSLPAVAGASLEDVRDACEAAAIRPDRHVIVYCTIGNRASMVWYALKHLLGYPRVSVYYGSWAEWGTSRDTPVQVAAPSG